MAMIPRNIILAVVLAIVGCSAPGGNYVLTGRVLGSGQPLVGARVRVQGTSPRDPSQLALTDGDGRFSLAITGRRAGDRVTVSADAVGFRTRALVEVLPKSRTAEVDLPPVPQDTPGYAFQNIEFGNPPCNFCHFDQIDRWSKSQHSQAAHDPLTLDEYRRFVAWWQKLDPDTTSEAAAFAGPFLPANQKGDTGRIFNEDGGRYRVLGDRSTLGECAKCHTPTYALAGGEDFRPAVLANQQSVYSEGVTCDFCHKVKAVQLDTEADLILAGIDKVTMARPGPDEQVMFGQYDDVTFSLMQASYSPLLQSSEFCADCHEDAKVLSYEEVDGGGTPIGAPRERLIWGEDTYREWRFAPETVVGVHPPNVMSATGNGPFTTTDNYAGRPLVCQSCHMQDPPPDPQTGERITDYTDPRNNNPRLAVTAEAVRRDPETVYPHRFVGRSARFIAWATELSATARREGNELVVDVTVDNRHTGHDFPSGLPDRNALLIVEAQSGSTPLLQIAGPQLPAWASGDGQTDPSRDLAGRPGTGFARVLGDVDGVAPVFYLRAVGDAAQDTRLKPGARSQTSYRFAAPSGSVEVRVRIVHRLRFKMQSDRFLQANPTSDPAAFETPGDVVTLTVP